MDSAASSLQTSEKFVLRVYNKKFSAWSLDWFWRTKKIFESPYFYFLYIALFVFI